MRVEKPNNTVPAQPSPSQEGVFAADQPLAKIIMIMVLTVAATLVYLFFWSKILTSGITFTNGLKNIFLLVGTLLSFCLMLCFMALSFAVMARKLLVLVMSVISAGTVFIFFAPSLWSVMAVALVILGMLYWWREITADLKSRIKFIPSRTIGSGIKTMVSIMLLVSSLLYYSYLVTGPNATQRFTDSLVSSGTKAVNGVLSVYYKDKYTPVMSLDQFVSLISNINGDWKLNTGQAQLDQLINQGFSQAQQQLLIQAREDFLKTLGITASGNDNMNSVVEKIVRRNMDKYIGRFQKFIPAILALGLYLLLNVFNFIYSELAKALGFVLLKMLVALKFIKIKKIQVEAEKISL